MTKINKIECIFAGDIGGTKTRLGLFNVSQENVKCLKEKHYYNKEYDDFESILREFDLSGYRIVAACLGVAGPVIDGIAKMTNLPWRLDEKRLSLQLSSKKVELINDLMANAYGVHALKPKDMKVLNIGARRLGNMAIFSAGTGLGAAMLIWDGKHHKPYPSQGGLVEFGARNRQDIELFEYVYSRFGRVSYESILSGAGLYLIYQFIRDTNKFKNEPTWLTSRLNREDPPAVITEIAQLRKNRYCEKALDIFTSIYGSAAANLAFHVMAVGGIYIGGGIAPKIIWKLQEGTFMRAFIDKGPLSTIAADIPVKVIMNDRSPLLGAALRARYLMNLR